MINVVIGAVNRGYYSHATFTIAYPFIRRLLGEFESVMIPERVRYLIRAEPPRSEERRFIDYYYWFWTAQALSNLRGSFLEKGGREFWGRSWTRALQEVLLSRQQQGGCAEGSWPADGKWCFAGGRLYSTAMAVLALEAPYRYSTDKGKLRPPSWDRYRQQVQKEVKKLLAKLSSKKMRERDEAMEKLLRIGEVVAEILEAAELPTDPDARWRLRWVLSRLRQR
jgi:hypothetical protein